MNMGPYGIANFKKLPHLPISFQSFPTFPDFFFILTGQVFLKSLYLSKEWGKATCYYWTSTGRHIQGSNRAIKFYSWKALKGQLNGHSKWTNAMIIKTDNRKAKSGEKLHLQGKSNVCEGYL